MPQQNLIAQSIAAADATAASTAVDDLVAALDKYLMNLSPEQRRRLPKISTQDRALAQDALAVVTNNSDFMAKSFSVPDFKQDIDFFDALSKIYLKLQPFMEKLDDTMLAARSDLDNQMRDVYTSAKRNNVTAGLDSLTNYFGQRFRRTPKTPPKP